MKSKRLKYWFSLSMVLLIVLGNIYSHASAMGPLDIQLTPKTTDAASKGEYKGSQFRVTFGPNNHTFATMDISLKDKKTTINSLQNDEKPEAEMVGKEYGNFKITDSNHNVKYNKSYIWDTSSQNTETVGLTTGDYIVMQSQNGNVIENLETKEKLPSKTNITYQVTSEGLQEVDPSAKKARDPTSEKKDSQENASTGALGNAQGKATMT